MLFLGTEGRAGMVAIINERMELDVKQLNHRMQQCLPRYAQPVFLRLVNKLDMTGINRFHTPTRLLHVHFHMLRLNAR